jgi:hypothetical protein
MNYVDLAVIVAASLTSVFIVLQLGNEPKPPKQKKSKQVAEVQKAPVSPVVTEIAETVKTANATANQDEIVAVISAVIACMGTGNVRIKSVKRVKTNTDVWGLENRRALTKPF